jgi:hypothetical protein
LNGFERNEGIKRGIELDRMYAKMPKNIQMMRELKLNFTSELWNLIIGFSIKSNKCNKIKSVD